MIRQFGQFCFLLHASLFLCVIAACSNENNTNKNQEVQKAIPADLQAQEGISHDQMQQDKENAAVETSPKQNLEANPVDSSSNNQTEEKSISDVDNVKTKLQELEANLDENNTENEALRQHMEVLLKKVQENQNTLEKFEQTKK